MPKQFQIYIFLLFVVVFTTSGCDFFGKQVPKVDATRTAAPILDEIIGTWSYIDVVKSPSNSPDTVIQTRFTFDGTGSFFLAFEDLLSGGVTMSASGKYGYAAPSDLLAAYLLSSTNDPSSSLVGTKLEMRKPAVANRIFSYEDSQGGSALMFAALASPPVPLPVGVWKFDGAFGLDFIVIATDRYSVVQMRDENNSPYLVDAIVTARATGQLEVFLFNEGPLDVVASMTFDSYSVTATTLTLSSGGVSHSGRRL